MIFKTTLLRGILLWIFLFLLTILSTVRAQKDEFIGTQEKRILDTILDPKYYDKNFRPAKSNASDTTEVSVRMRINKIEEPDDMTKEFKLDFTLRQEWLDERLRFSNLNYEIQDLNAPYSAVGKIWLPDINLLNKVFSTSIENKSFREQVHLFPDGRVLFLKRFVGTFYCPMQFKDYPHDEQICSLQITSYGYKEENLLFEWNEESQIDTNYTLFSLSQHSLILISSSNNCTSPDNASCIEVTFIFKRYLEPYLLRIYIPCSLFVIISFLSFFLHPVKMSSSRALIILISLTLAVVLVLHLNSNLPHVHYVKAIDIWTGTIITFLFFTLLEFILVSWTCKVINSNRSFNMEDGSSEDNTELPTVLKQFNKKSINNNSTIVCRRKDESEMIYTLFARNVDCVARILYPILFVCFVILYWLIYVEKLIL